MIYWAIFLLGVTIGALIEMVSVIILARRKNRKTIFEGDNIVTIQEWEDHRGRCSKKRKFTVFRIYEDKTVALIGNEDTDRNLRKLYHMEEE